MINSRVFLKDGMCEEHGLNAIAAALEPGDGVTRLPWTPEHQQALKSLQPGWLQPAFQYIWTRLGLCASPNPQGKPVLLLGSHQGSVRNGERHDGIMGVALACLAAERFRDSGIAACGGRDTGLCR